MKNLPEKDIILGLLVLIAFLGLLATSCYAQVWLPNTFFPSFASTFNPYYVPFLPVIPPNIPVVEPILTPYFASLPSLGRFANATIIIILPQPTNAVTAYAPLGTITLTPSVLAPVGLLLTLAE